MHNGDDLRGAYVDAFLGFVLNRPFLLLADSGLSNTATSVLRTHSRKRIMKKAHLLVLLISIAMWGCANLDQAKLAELILEVEPDANPWTNLDFNKN